MVIERLLLGEHHRLRRQTIATLAERLPWNVSVRSQQLRGEMATNWAVPDTRNTQ